jgi:hypothetical protein
VNATGEHGATLLDVAVRPRTDAVGLVFLPEKKIVDLLRAKGGKCLAGQC